MKNDPRSNVRGWLVAAALCGLSLSAQAAVKFPNIGQVSEGTSSEFATLLAQPMGHAVGTWPPGKMVPGGGWTLAGNYGVAPGVASGSVKVGTDAVATVAGKSVGVQVAGTISKADIAGAVVGCVAGTLVGCVAGVGIPLAIAYLTTSGARVSPTTPGQLERADPRLCYTAPCFQWYFSTDAAPASTYGYSLQYAAENWTAYRNTLVDSKTAVLRSCDTALNRCTWDFKSKTTGAIVAPLNYTQSASKFSASPASATWYPITPQEARDALIADNANNPPPLIVPELQKAGVDWNASWKDPTVTGPAEVKSAEKVTVKPDGTSSTSQSTTPLTYSGPKVTAGPSVETTIERNASGVTTGTTTVTTNPPPPGEGEATPEEKEQPTQCDKYPDTLGCAELDEPELEVPREERTITYAAESPFAGGSCPADQTFASTLAGRSFKAVDWVQWCSYAPTIRVLVILLATISAFFIVSLGKDSE